MEYGLVETVDPYMVDEMLERQEDFPKMWTGAGERALQDYGGFGLFTSTTTDESWQTGHGVLPKFFNAIRIKNYFPTVLEKTQTFVEQWAKLGNNAVIEDVNDWFEMLKSDLPRPNKNFLCQRLLEQLI